MKSEPESSREEWFQAKTVAFVSITKTEARINFTDGTFAEFLAEREWTDPNRIMPARPVLNIYITVARQMIKVGF